MNFNQLKYFIELARVRNFSESAKVLSISQPALSLQIQKLEDEFEYKLLDRTKKPLALTEEGELFYEKALEIVQLVEHLENLNLEIEEKIEGILRVGIIPTLSPYLVPLFMGKLKQTYPKLGVHIEELKTDEILDQLAHNELDLGLISTPVKASKIGFVPLFYERFYVYLSPDQPLFDQDSIDLKAINMDKLWYLHEGNCFQNQVNTVCEIRDIRQSELPFQYASNSIESLKRIVESEGGMTFIPELATSQIAAEYENMVKPIAQPTPTREISAAYLRTTGLKRTAKALIELLSSCIPARMQQKPTTPSIDTRIRM